MYALNQPAAYKYIVITLLFELSVSFEKRAQASDFIQRYLEKKKVIVTAPTPVFFCLINFSHIILDRCMCSQKMDSSDSHSYRNSVIFSEAKRKTKNSAI